MAQPEIDGSPRSREIEAKTQYLARPGGRIAYDVRGEGPLCVGVPGMGDLRSNFRHLVPALVGAGYRVATMDLRGHGESDASFESYDDVAAGCDVLALIAELGGPAVIIGSSMGAGAAAWAAAEDPPAVAALVLLGPFVRNPPTSWLKLVLFRLALLRPWGAAAWRSYIPKLYPGRPPPDLDAHRAEIGESLAKPGHWAAFARTSHTSHAPAEARLDRVRAPTLVVMGERDPDFDDPRAEAAYVADRLRAESLLVPDAGHYPHAEYPELVNPVIVNFLGEVKSA